MRGKLPPARSTPSRPPTPTLSHKGRGRRALLIAAAALLVAPLCARAATDEIVIARQPGLTDFALTVVENKGLLEKRLAEAGLSAVKPHWVTFGSVPAMVDSLLSGSAHVVQSGVPALLTLWSRTQGAVKGVAVASRMPYYLNTRNPDVKSLRDFTDADRIALPGVKVSAQAIVLAMAAEKEFGPGQQERLDKLTVTLPNTEAMAALVTGRSEITAHFAPAPYQTDELRRPGIHRVLSSYDIFGGPTSGGIIISTQKFYDANPKAIEALQRAVADAMALINADKDAAAALYLELSKEKSSVEQIREAMTTLDYDMVPANVMKYAEFMHRTGRIAKLPASLDEIFLPGEWLKGGS